MQEANDGKAKFRFKMHHVLGALSHTQRQQIGCQFGWFAFNVLYLIVNGWTFEGKESEKKMKNDIEHRGDWE